MKISNFQIPFISKAGGASLVYFGRDFKNIHRVVLIQNYKNFLEIN